MSGFGVNFLAPDVCAADTDQAVDCDGTKTWRSWGHGFTYLGKCANKQCLAHTDDHAFDGEVTHEMEMQNTIRPNEDEMTQSIRCELSCDTPFIPDQYILWDCSVKIDFKFAGEGQPMHTVTYTTGEDKPSQRFYLELGKAGEKLMYSAVRITVAKHDAYPNSDPDPSKGIFKTYIDPLNKVPLPPGSPPREPRIKVVSVTPFNDAKKQLCIMVPEMKKLLANAERLSQTLMGL